MLQCNCDAGPTSYVAVPPCLPRCCDCTCCPSCLQNLLRGVQHVREAPPSLVRMSIDTPATQRRGMAEMPPLGQVQGLFTGGGRRPAQQAQQGSHQRQQQRPSAYVELQPLGRTTRMGGGLGTLHGGSSPTASQASRLASRVCLLQAALHGGAQAPRPCRLSPATSPATRCPPACRLQMQDAALLRQVVDMRLKQEELQRQQRRQQEQVGTAGNWGSALGLPACLPLAALPCKAPAGQLAWPQAQGVQPGCSHVAHTALLLLLVVCSRRQQPPGWRKSTSLGRPPRSSRRRRCTSSSGTSSSCPASRQRPGWEHPSSPGGLSGGPCCARWRLLSWMSWTT